MRISTSQMYDSAINAMLDQQAKVNKTQLQVSSGERVMVPADDPVASALTLNLNQALDTTQQYQFNANAATARLSLEESTLSSETNQIQRLRELAVQANNATNTSADLRAISTEAKQILKSMLGLANTVDQNNVYLFSGHQGNNKPFSATASGSFSYAGDAGQRQVQIGASRTVADSDPGSAVFMTIRTGNGTFTTRDNPANTGNGIIDPGNVINPTAYVPDTYTITFVTNSAGQLAYNVFGTNGGQIVPPLPQNATTNAPTYVAGASISFKGVQTNIKGVPAVGDSFTLSPSNNQSLFETAQKLINTLDAGVGNNASRARLANGINRGLSDLDQSLGHILNTRARIGARLNAIDSQTNNNSNLIFQVKKTLSSTNDLNYASAISTLDQQLLGLQAAQKAFTRVQGLSLFKYL